MEDIIEEATLLAKKGVKELLIIAQDLSFYGMDRYKKSMLDELLNKLSDIPGIEWIKLHYAYPAGFPYKILPVMRERKNMARYLDIALQHSSNHMLKIMRRNITREKTIELLNRIRKEVPGIHIRTTMLVGHPGETEEDFEDLKAFVREMRFERLGVFPYSFEEDTYAGENYKDDVPQEVKEARAAELMQIQQEIAAEITAEKVGTEMKVLIDRKDDDFYVGRTEFDSPEVDGEVYIDSQGKELEVGNFCQVEITHTNDYDLYGVVK